MDTSNDIPPELMKSWLRGDKKPEPKDAPDTRPEPAKDRIADEQDAPDIPPELMKNWLPREDKKPEPSVPDIPPELMRDWLFGGKTKLESSESSFGDEPALDPFEDFAEDLRAADREINMGHCERIMSRLARATRRKAGENIADRLYGEHFGRNGWLPVVDWELNRIPGPVYRAFEAALMLSGVLATGLIFLKDDGTAGGVTQTGLFKHAMSQLSGAIARAAPGRHIIVATRVNFLGPDGIMRENSAMGPTWIVGEKGCEPLRVKSGENPLLAMRAAIEKACGKQAAYRLNNEYERRTK